MADLRISDLVTASQLKDDDYYEIAQSESGTRVSYKTTLLAIAVQIATMVDFTSDLNTTSKRITGAINELKQLISLIPQFSIEVVQVLPTEDISDTTIYLVPAEDPETGNYYEEYIHVNNTWELVGTTAVDLSAYYTKLEVDGLLADKLEADDFEANQTASANPITLETKQAGLAKSCVVEMSPIQDLHGYDHPWAGGAGKNKFVPWSLTAGGLSFVNDNDKLVITVNSTNVYVMTKVFEKSLGEMEQAGLIVDGHTYTAKQNGENQGGLKLQLSNGVGGGISDLLNGYTFTYNSSTMSAYTFVIRKYGDVTAGDVITFYPQLEEGSSATDWTPYSNICPISGRTEASVTRTAGEDAETKTHTYTDPIYGGVDDFVNGGLDVTHNYIKGTSSNIVRNSGTSWYIAKPDDIKVTGEEQRGVLYCNCFPSSQVFIHPLGLIRFNTTTEYASVADLLTAIPDIEFVYPKETSTTIQLSPEALTLLKGLNVISTDGDKVQVEFSDIPVGDYSTILDYVKSLEERIEALEG